MRQYTIHRGPLEPGYKILGEGKQILFAEMDFDLDEDGPTLTLRDPNKGQPHIAISHIPWVSRKIHIGFTDSDKPQGMHWEDMEKSRFSWKGHSGSEYSWITTLRWEEKKAQLRWITDQTWLTSRRNHTLLNQKTSEVIAEFKVNRNLHMGGVLKIYKGCEREFGEFDIRVLMSFLAIYEKARRRAHVTMYKIQRRQKLPIAEA